MEAGEAHVNSRGPGLAARTGELHAVQRTGKRAALSSVGVGMLSIGKAEWPSGIGNLNIKLVILLELIYRFKTTPSKNPGGF